jgi:Domain of unknown function (DUF1906)
MTTITLADFYSNTTNPETIKNLGYQGFSAYISHEPAKNATPQELWAGHNDGLIIALNFEDAATNALGGYQQGTDDAYFVLQCLAALPYPEGNIIAFSVDFEATPEQYTTIINYFSGVIAQMDGKYLITDYADFDVVEMLHSVHGIYGWQTESWSGGRVSSHAYLYQDYYGQTFDSDRLEFNVPMWGLTVDPVKPPIPKPKPVPTPGDNMYYVAMLTGAAIGTPEYLICPNMTKIHLPDSASSTAAQAEFGTIKQWPQSLLNLWTTVVSVE